MAARKPPLVCQHLENVSYRMLEKYQALIRDFVRGRNGVYALFRRDRLYCVGLASSLLGRLKMHLRDHHAGTWDRFSVYLTIGPQHMREIESLICRIARPPGNKTRGKFTRSQDLLPELKEAYRRRMRQEEGDLFGPRRTGRKPVPSEAKRPKSGRKGEAVVLAPYAGKVRELRGRHKGRTIRAWVRLDGRIRLDGHVYNSPSSAGAVACGRRACSGWTFWQYERAPGDWVPLAELRK